MQSRLKRNAENNVNAITDQGEGDGVATTICKRWADEQWAKNVLATKTNTQMNEHPSTVEEQFQPSAEALKHDYPASNGPISGSACARITNKYKDHFQIFTDTMQLIVEYENTADYLYHWPFGLKKVINGYWLSPKHGDKPAGYDTARCFPIADVQA